MLSLGIGGFTGLEGHRLHSTPSSDTTEVDRAKANSRLLSQIIVVDEVKRLEEIRWAAARGDYDQATIGELTTMRDEFGKQQHSLDCDPALHERIEQLENEFHLAGEIPESHRDSKVSAEDIKPILVLALNGAKNICRP